MQYSAEKTKQVKVKVVTGRSTVAAVLVAGELPDLLQNGPRELLHALIVWTELCTRRVAEHFHQHLLLGVV